MTNNVKAFDFNGVKVLRDVNTRFIKFRGSAAAGALTFHDESDDSNYQVPGGKKLTIIFIEMFDSTNADAQFMFADDLDGTLNLVTLYIPVVTTRIENFIFISAEVPADKFVGQNSSAGWNTIPVCFGIEENV